MQSRRPRYYIPNGSDKPTHLPGGVPIVDLHQGYGPDVDACDTAPGGGTIIGGTFRENEPGWIYDKTEAIWINLDGVTPAACRRLNAIAGPIIEGASPAHQWQVPHLLSRTPDDGWESALDPVLTRNGFEVPEAFRYISDRVRWAVDTCAEIETDQDLDPFVKLAQDLLKLNYHVSELEFITGEWFTLSMVSRIIMGSATGSAHG